MTSDILREVADPSRRRILTELLDGAKNVSQLVTATGLKQPNVSNHLAKLRARNIVRAVRQGRQVYYAMSDPSVATALTNVLGSNTDALPQIELSTDTVKQFTRSAISSDKTACTRIVDSLLKQQVPLLEIYERLFEAAMRLVGNWYQVEAIDEGQEHVASAIIERLMARAMHFAGHVPGSSRLAVLGCCEGNWHTIGLRMVSDALRLSGWKTHYLGGSVPAKAFVSAIKQFDARAACIGCTSDEDLPSCMELIAALCEAREEEQLKFAIVVGGLRVGTDPALFTSRGADMTSTSVSQFSTCVIPRLELL